jgi:hypothetical protein
MDWYVTTMQKKNYYTVLVRKDLGKWILARVKRK